MFVVLLTVAILGSTARLPPHLRETPLFSDSPISVSILIFYCDCFLTPPRPISVSTVIFYCDCFLIPPITVSIVKEIHSTVFKARFYLCIQNGRLVTISLSEGFNQCQEVGLLGKVCVTVCGHQIG